MASPILLLQALAAQKPPADLAALAEQVAKLSEKEPVLWPYISAITALGAACVAMFGVIVKFSRDHAKQLETIGTEAQTRLDTAATEAQKRLAEAHENHRKADEEKSRRIADEFQKKDTQLFEWATKASTFLERVASEISGQSTILDALTSELRDAAKQRRGSE